MESKIRDHVEYLFLSAPRTARAVEMKEELIANLLDRYADLLAQGEAEEAAYGIAIAGIGDVEDLIRSLQEQERRDPLDAQYQRQKSAALTATAVGLFIGSVIFPVIFFSMSRWFGGGAFGVLGVVLMVLCIAVGVALLVYNARSKPPEPFSPSPTPQPSYTPPAYDPVREAPPNPQVKGKASPLQKTIQAILWSATVPIYLMLGLFLNGWSTGWLIFLLAPVLSNIVRLLFLLKEGEQ